MLQRSDPPGNGGAIAPLIARLKEDARRWVKAELALIASLGTARLRALRTPAILLTTAALLAHAVLFVLIATLFVLLAQWMNDALAGLATALIVAAVAAILGWVGWSRLRAIGRQGD